MGAENLQVVGTNETEHSHTAIIGRNDHKTETPSDVAWAIISEWNLAKGYVSHESLVRLSKVLHPEVTQ